MPSNKPTEPMNDPLKLRAALLSACMNLTQGDFDKALELYEHYYDNSLEELKELLPPGVTFEDLN